MNNGVCLNKITYDIFLTIYKYLLLKDTSNMMLSCKEFSKINDDILAYIMCNYYPKEFWEKAFRRNKTISLPLGSSKKELERLKIFEYNMGGEWKLENYYKLWKSIEL